VKDKTLRISEKYDSRRPDRPQAAVFYRGDVLLGGGVIDHAD